MGFTYKSYNFIDKDPMIDEIRTIVEQSGASYKWVHENSNVAVGTLTAWFDGKTRRPQAATMNAVLRALGKKLGIVDDHVVIVPVEGRQPNPPRRASPIRHVVQMAKYKRAGR
jgi:hypothetical protein